MAKVQRLQIKRRDVILLVGTVKGAFILRSNATRRRWEVGGPFFQGEAIYSMAYDGRVGRQRVWAGRLSFHFGAGLSSSDDFGAHWTDPPARPIRFPEDTGAELKHIWQIRPGRASEPDVLYAGVEPAALFESRDNGESWSLMRGLWEHPHRGRWEPGFGGLCLHTVLPHPTDPRRITVAISSGGVYRTDDGGRTWQARNAGVRAEFLPDKHPEFGQCVHKIAMHPAHPDRLFLQNHWGLYRSDDGGDSWKDIAKGVPSDFGFCMVAHPHDPETVYIIPLESDAFRCTPEAKLRVYRTRDGGKRWEPLTAGLPQKDALETVLRDAMDADALNPAGVYFGTRSGKLFGSADGGHTWDLIRDGLPGILCVRAAVVGDAAGVRVPAARRAAAARRGTAGVAKRGVAKRGVPKRGVAKRGVAKRGVARGRTAVAARGPKRDAAHLPGMATGPRPAKKR